MLVRPRRDDDLPGCVELLGSSHLHDDYPRWWPADPARFISSGRELGAWVGEVDGQVGGHVSLCRAGGDPTFAIARAATGRAEDELAVVSRLFTGGGGRRRGLGRALLHRAEAAAHDLGRVPVLDVGKTLFPAIALYESAGWRRAGEFDLVLPEGTLDLWVYVGPATPQPR